MKIFKEHKNLNYQRIIRLQFYVKIEILWDINPKPNRSNKRNNVH